MESIASYVTSVQTIPRGEHDDGSKKVGFLDAYSEANVNATASVKHA